MLLSPETITDLTPVFIMSVEWNKWNIEDEILYESSDQSIHQISSVNLLKDITEYMKSNNLKGKLPYIHIEGKNEMECYERPTDEIIIQYLKDNLKFYTVYDIEGNEERKAV